MSHSGGKRDAVVRGESIGAAVVVVVLLLLGFMLGQGSGGGGIPGLFLGGLASAAFLAKRGREKIVRQRQAEYLAREQAAAAAESARQQAAAAEAESRRIEEEARKRAAIEARYRDLDVDGLRAAEKAISSEKTETVSNLEEARHWYNVRREAFEQHSGEEGWEWYLLAQEPQSKRLDDAQKRLSYLDEQLAIVTSLMRQHGALSSKAEGLSAVLGEYTSFERSITLTVEVSGDGSSFPLTAVAWIAHESEGATSSARRVSATSTIPNAGFYQLRFDADSVRASVAGLARSEISADTWSMSVMLELRDGAAVIVTTSCYSVKAHAVAGGGSPQNAADSAAT